jgi:hypothetical protein
MYLTGTSNYNVICIVTMLVHNLLDPSTRNEAPHSIIIYNKTTTIHRTTDRAASHSKHLTNHFSNPHFSPYNITTPFKYFPPSSVFLVKALLLLFHPQAALFLLPSRSIPSFPSSPSAPYRLIRAATYRLPLTVGLLRLTLRPIDKVGPAVV